MSNLEIVHKMYQCFKTGDMATLKAEVFAEDIVWNLPGHNPLAGTKRGVNEVLAFFGRLRALGAQVQPLEMGELSNGGVADVHRAHGERNGGQMGAVNCNSNTILNGKIPPVQV